MMIEVSVIVPCFNCEEWIEKCLDSMHDQTFSHDKFEVICIDDCSQDDTVHLINQLETKYDFQIKVIQLPENVGPGKARNIAIRSARGEWLTFCDSDDWYEADFLSEMHTAVIESGSDIAMCEYRKVFESQKNAENVCYLAGVSPNASQEELIINSKASLCLLMIRKNLFVGREIPDLRNGEDIAFVPCIETAANSICIVKKVLYNYYIRSKSASNCINESVYRSLLDSYAYVEKQFGQKYQAALEFLGVRTVLYGALLNAFKLPRTSKIGKNIIFEFEKRYPLWWENKYIATLSLPKRAFLFGVKTKKIWICRMIAFVHAKVSV